MSTESRRPVVVGYDGSTAASAALAVAADAALSLGAPLRIVHAYVWPVLYAPLANVPYRAGDWQPPAATVANIDTTARRVEAEHPGLAVESRVVAGAGGPTLVDASRDACLVVVGRSGIGGVAGMLAGSVAPYVSSQAECPVIVANPRQVRDGLNDGGICVGVDGTASSLAALSFACGWAERAGLGVDVVHVVGPDTFDEAAPEFQQRTPAQVRLDGWVSDARAAFPAVPVTGRVVRGEPEPAMIAASRDSRLVVVGSRGRGELASIALGSVGYRLIRHAACHVAVVHGGLDRAAAPAAAVEHAHPGPY